jgi:spore maturation protein CgeB
MKILVVMESWDMPPGPHETLYRYYYKALTALGHEVRVVDNKWNYLSIGGPTMWNYGRWATRLRLHRFNNFMVNRRLMRIAGTWQPDLILFGKCENIFWTTTAWLKENTRAVLFNWNHDNPFWPSNTSIHLIKSLQFYDAYGAIARVLIPVLLQIGCKRPEFLPMFFEPERFRLEHMTPDPAYQCDIAFVGTGSPERADMLRHLVDFDLGIWGNWEMLHEDDPLRQHVRGRYLNGKQYAQVLQQAKIAVNVLNMPNRFGSNTRTFEATGLGTLLITEYTKEQAEDLFRENEEIVCFRSSEELRDKIRYYLTHDAERERIAAAGQARTLREHTLAHRLRKIVNITEEILAERRSGKKR